MVLADFTSVEIDTPEDLERARALLNTLKTSGAGQPE
jgi:choline kinase